MKITYFGFAANPPTLSHAEAIAWLAKRYDQVIVAPAAAHAFGKNLPPMEVRMALAEAMLKQVDADNVMLTNLEQSLATQEFDDEDKDEPVYSYTVLCALRSIYPGATIHLAVGPDNAEPATWQRFFRYADIDRHFGKVVVPDMGPTRSTLVRQVLKEGPTKARLVPLVGPDVAELLLELHYTGDKT